MHVSDLSRREKEVLFQVALGLNNALIAARLQINKKTVENHMRNILQKLNAKNRTEAVIIAILNSTIVLSELRRSYLEMLYSR